MRRRLYFLLPDPASALAQFSQAIEQGKLLVMADIPERRVAEVRENLGLRHPDPIFRYRRTRGRGRTSSWRAGCARPDSAEWSTRTRAGALSAWTST